MIVLPYTENRMIVASFVSTQYQHVMEGQTDGQMADRAISNTAVALQAMPSHYKIFISWGDLTHLRDNLKNVIMWGILTYNVH